MHVQVAGRRGICAVLFLLRESWNFVLAGRGVVFVMLCRRKEQTYEAIAEWKRRCADYGRARRAEETPEEREHRLAREREAKGAHSASLEGCAKRRRAGKGLYLITLHGVPVNRGNVGDFRKSDGT